MNLWQKIVDVRKSIGTLHKDREGYNYEYVTGNQILGKIKDKMNELNLILQPSTESGEWKRHDYKNKYDKDKIDFIVWGQGSYTWINADNPEEREVVPFAYYGQQGDDLSQAYGTALTYAERYFLLKYFGIPTDEDDPDARERDKGKPQNKAPQGNKRDFAQELIDLAESKGFSVKDILAQNQKIGGNSASEVKYIKKEYKQQLTDMLDKMPDVFPK